MNDLKEILMRRSVINLALRSLYRDPVDYYGCNSELLWNPDVWVQLSEDEETRDFIIVLARRKSFLRCVAANVLKLWYSHTEVNARLDHGRMFVLSTEQARLLIKGGGTFCDIGAGCGIVTEYLAPLFDTVSATEVSPRMQVCLSRKGFSINSVPPFETVSCLNVLDRCDDPIALLNHVYELLSPGGTFLLAVVLPFEGWVEDPVSGIWNSPTVDITSQFKAAGLSFESQVNLLALEFLPKSGFSVQSVSKVPYISETDDYLSETAILCDAILVCIKV